MTDFFFVCVYQRCSHPIPKSIKRKEFTTFEYIQVFEQNCPLLFDVMAMKIFKKFWSGAEELDEMFSFNAISWRTNLNSCQDHGATKWFSDKLSDTPFQVVSLFFELNHDSLSFTSIRDGLYFDCSKISEKLLFPLTVRGEKEQST